VTATGATPAALSLVGVSKRFGPARVLDNVGLTLRPGEMHGLIGQNGSGKSTLIKALSGFHKADSGHVLADGREHALPLGAAELDRLGIAFVHQDLGLVDNASVVDNIRGRPLHPRTVEPPGPAYRRGGGRSLDPRTSRFRGRPARTAGWAPARRPGHRRHRPNIAAANREGAQVPGAPPARLEMQVVEGVRAHTSSIELAGGPGTTWGWSAAGSRVCRSGRTAAPGEAAAPGVTALARTWSGRGAATEPPALGDTRVSVFRTWGLAVGDRRARPPERFRS
jgi:ABC-type Fe3+/spermidine/putrescine transport system ATPase subunit